MILVLALDAQVKRYFLDVLQVYIRRDVEKLGLECPPGQ
jgi:hypothetical protein